MEKTFLFKIMHKVNSFAKSVEPILDDLRVNRPIKHFIITVIIPMFLGYLLGVLTN